jgi:uracil-DNA glycosylase family 4
VDFRLEARAKEPGWHNAPVPTLGDASARLLIVGLAPGMRGANRTGRPFTGDWAGDLLFETLGDLGFTSGTYDENGDDDLQLVDTRITNAVRCVPPQNKPTPAEIKTCRTFLDETIAAMPRLKAIVALGRISHDSVTRALGEGPSRLPFAHGREFALPQIGGGVTLFDSYHCSRYNTNTGVLTPQMFHAVFARVRGLLDGVSASPAP